MGGQRAGPRSSWSNDVIYTCPCFSYASADLFRDFEPITVGGQRPRWRRCGSIPPEWPCHLSYFRAFFFTQGRSMTTLSTLARPFSLPPMRHWFFAFPHHPQLNAFYCLLARFSRPNHSRSTFSHDGALLRAPFYLGVCTLTVRPQPARGQATPSSIAPSCARPCP